MIKIADFIISLFSAEPLVASLVFIIILLIFKKEIGNFITKYIITKLKLKFAKKKQEEETISSAVADLDSFVDDVKWCFDFKDHVVIPEKEVLYDALMHVIDINRHKGRMLILDMSSMSRINENTREAIRDSIKETIDENNIRMKLIFPKTTKKDIITTLFEELLDYSVTKGSKSVDIFIDKRAKTRKK